MGTEVKVDAALAEKLGLTEFEFNRILELLGRAAELHGIGRVFRHVVGTLQAYKNSRKLFKLFPTKARRCGGRPRGNSAW